MTIYAVFQDKVILAGISVRVRDYVSIIIPQILPRDTAVTVVGVVLAQCGEDRVVCIDVRLTQVLHDGAVRVRDGLRDVDVAVGGLRHYGGDGGLQTEGVVEDLLELRSGAVGLGDDGARRLRIAVVGRLRLKAYLRALRVVVPRPKVALAEVGVEEVAADDCPLLRDGVAVGGADLHSDGGDVDARRHPVQILISVIERRGDVVEDTPVGLYLGIEALHAGCRGVISLLTAHAGVGILIRAHGNGGEQRPHDGEYGHGDEHHHEGCSPLAFSRRKASEPHVFLLPPCSPAGSG